MTSPNTQRDFQNADPSTNVRSSRHLRLAGTPPPMSHPHDSIYGPNKPVNLTLRAEGQAIVSIAMMMDRLDSTGGEGLGMPETTDEKAAKQEFFGKAMSALIAGEGDPSIFHPN